MAVRDPLAESRVLMGMLAASYDEADIAAVKAVSAGNASPEQQKRALDWIINRAARTYDEPFMPGMPDLSDHLSGRRNVGLQIVKLINTPKAKLLPAAKLAEERRKTRNG